MNFDEFLDGWKLIRFWWWVIRITLRYGVGGGLRSRLLLFLFTFQSTRQTGFRVQRADVKPKERAAEARSLIFAHVETPITGIDESR